MQLVKVGVQPQTLGAPPPPQLSGGAHPPQKTCPRQPSSSCPQFLCSRLQVVGTHTPEQALGPFQATPGGANPLPESQGWWMSAAQSAPRLV